MNILTRHRDLVEIPEPLPLVVPRDVVAQADGREADEHEVETVQPRPVGLKGPERKGGDWGEGNVSDRYPDYCTVSVGVDVRGNKIVPHIPVSAIMLLEYIKFAASLFNNK